MGVGEALPYAAASFDAVVCVDVLEHVQDLDRVLAERQGHSFSDLLAGETDLAVMAAALFAYFSDADTPGRGVDGPGPTPWRRAARLDGVRR